MKAMRAFGNHQSGSSMIDVIFALGLLAAATVGFMHFSKISMQNRTYADFTRHENLIKALLLEGTDCSKLPACKTGESRALRDQDDRLLVNEEGTTRYGPWQVRAQCLANQTLEVRLASFTDNVPRKDPLTGAPLDWQNPRSILIKGGYLCGKLSESLSAKKLETLRSPRCLRQMGTCPPPAAAKGIASAPQRMCCESGKDMKRPTCPANKDEIGAYWDREGDWGADGSWVVLCQ